MTSKETLRLRLETLATIDAAVDRLATLFPDLNVFSVQHGALARIRQETSTLHERSLKLADERN
jgi:hypothetical protein